MRGLGRIGCILYLACCVLCFAYSQAGNGVKRVITEENYQYLLGLIKSYQGQIKAKNASLLSLNEQALLRERDLEKRVATLKSGQLEITKLSSEQIKKSNELLKKARILNTVGWAVAGVSVSALLGVLIWQAVK